MNSPFPKKSAWKVEINKAPQTWLGKVVTAIIIVFSMWIVVLSFTVIFIVIAGVSVFAFVLLALTFNKSEKGQQVHLFKLNRIGHRKIKRNELKE